MRDILKDICRLRSIKHIKHQFPFASDLPEIKTDGGSVNTAPTDDSISKGESQESELEPVEVVVDSLQGFDQRAFADRNDQFKNAIFLPDPVLETLFSEQHSKRGYVQVTSEKGQNTEQFYALPFGDDQSPQRDPESSLYRGYLRSNLQEQIGGDPQNPTTRVNLEPVDVPETDPLTLTRLSTHLETTENALAHANPTVFNELAIESGENVEVFNPETGARMFIEVRAAPSLDKSHVALSTYVRKLLQVEVPENTDNESVITQVRLRKRIHSGNVDRTWLGRIKDWILTQAVDYHEIDLRVYPAPNTDENRNVARLNEETMRILGIQDGDKIVVSSPQHRKSLRCLLASEESYLIKQDVSFQPGDISDRNILLPATEREAINTLVHDVVRVHRDPEYVVGKQVVPSLFSLLGVFIGGTQLLEVAAPDLPQVAAILLLSMFGVLAVWIVLWPERQKCR